MSNWEKNVRKVVPYVPGEQPKEQDIIKLNTNENPYPPAPEVLDKQVELANLRLYPDPAATKLVEAIAQYHGVDKKQVFVGVGSDDVLAMSFMTFFNSDKPTIEKILLSLYNICNDKDTIFDIYLYYDLNNNKEQAQKYRNEFIKLYFNTDDIDTELVLLDMLRRNVDKYNFKLMVKKIMGKVNQYTSPNTEKANKIIQTQKLLLKSKNTERV